MKKIVIFGAGKIGRSFIGQVFSRGGYEAIFVDINKELINLLNQKREYKVVIKDKNATTITVAPVRGIHISDIDLIVKEMQDVNIAAVSVGKNGLTGVVPILAKVLVSREQAAIQTPIDLIAAENVRNADQFIFNTIEKLLPTDFPLQKRLGIIETSIGKMVPIMRQTDIIQDPLQVFAEQYNTLIVAKNGFLNKIPDVPDLAPKENMKAWVDCKLFIHNLGHASAAYLGNFFHPECNYMYEVLQFDPVKKQVEQIMFQSAKILQTLYPNEFSDDFLSYHIKDLIDRFENKALGDTVFRVGCDLKRKLGENDRIIAPLKYGVKHQLSVQMIIKALVAACFFSATDENNNSFREDATIVTQAQELGIEYILTNYCNIKAEKYQDIFNQIVEQYRIYSERWKIYKIQDTYI